MTTKPEAEQDQAEPHLGRRGQREPRAVERRPEHREQRGQDEDQERVDRLIPRRREWLWPKSDPVGLLVGEEGERPARLLEAHPEDDREDRDDQDDRDPLPVRLGERRVRVLRVLRPEPLGRPTSGSFGRARRSLQPRVSGTVTRSGRTRARSSSRGPRSSRRPGPSGRSPPRESRGVDDADARQRDQGDVDPVDRHEPRLAGSLTAGRIAVRPERTAAESEEAIRPKTMPTPAAPKP